MRVLIVADCVSPEQAQEAAPGCVTACVDSFTAAFEAITRRSVDVVVTPEAIGERNSGSGLDVARLAMGYSVACVIVSEDWTDGVYLAAMMTAGGDLRDAITRAVRLRS